MPSKRRKSKKRRNELNEFGLMGLSRAERIGNILAHVKGFTAGPTPSAVGPAPAERGCRMLARLGDQVARAAAEIA